MIIVLLLVIIAILLFGAAKVRGALRLLLLVAAAVATWLVVSGAIDRVGTFNYEVLGYAAFLAAFATVYVRVIRRFHHDKD